MHIYIRSADLATEILGVTLKEGYIPTIGTQRPRTGKNGDLLQVEPAVWFKVLVLDSVSIDCTRRAVMWNSTYKGLGGKSNSKGGKKSPPGGGSRRKQVTESVFIGGELYNFHADLDHLFDTCQRLLGEYAHSYISMAEFNQEMLQLLHCYILPSITLSGDDFDKLEEVHAKQIHELELVDQEIDTRQRQYDSINKSLKKQLLVFVNELQAEDTSRNRDSYPVMFIKELQSSVDGEMANAWKMVDDIQGEVDKSKNNSDEEQLKRKRQERDKIYKEYEKLMFARETLRSVLEKAQAANEAKRSFTESIRSSLRAKKSTRVKELEENPLHRIFIETNRKLEEVQVGVKFLTDKKVLMLSVKEAMRTTLEELHKGEDSAGCSFDQTGRVMDTDVLEKNSDIPLPTGWQTLSEKVRNIVLNGKHRVGFMHEQFCREFKEKCETLMKRQLQKESPETSVTKSLDSLDLSLSLKSPVSYSENANSDSEPQVYSLTDSGELIKLRGDAQIPHRPMLEHLKRDITQHLDEICRDLQTELGKDQQTALNKIQVCYEMVFYKAIMPSLEKVYSAAYAQVCENLRTMIPCLTVSDLDMCGELSCRLIEKPLQSSYEEIANQTAFQMQTGRPEPEEEPVIDLESSQDFDTIDETVVEQTEVKRPIDFSHTADTLPIFPVVCSGFESLPGTPSTNLTSPYSSPVKQRLSDVASPTEKFSSTSLVEHRTAERTVSADRRSFVKRIKGNLSNPLTMLYNRRTWPTAPRSSGIEIASEATSLVPDKTSGYSTPVAPVVTSNLQTQQPRLQENYLNRFKTAIAALDVVIAETSPISKLQNVTKCLRAINSQVALFQEELLNKDEGACSDDLIDMLVLLLCNIDSDLVAKFYPHLMLMEDYMPQFLEGGPYSFSLVQFSVAYQFFQTQILFKLRREGKLSDKEKNL